MYENLLDQPGHIRGDRGGKVASRGWWSTNAEEGRMFRCSSNGSSSAVVGPEGGLLWMARVLLTPQYFSEESLTTKITGLLLAMKNGISRIVCLFS